MPTETKETVTTDLTASKAKRMSERIRDQVVKVEGEQGTLRNLLVDFNEGNGWKALGYRNWEGWATKVLPQSRSMLFRQLAAGQHEAALGINVGDTPESHLRNLSKVPAEKRQDVMDRADVLAVEADRPRQAGDVRAAIREVVPTTARVVDGQATTEARPISAAPRDSVGVDIPEALLGVFDAASAPFAEGMRLLMQLKTLIGEMVEGKASRFIGNQLQSLEHDRMNMFASIKFGKPYAVCPYCKGLKKSCKACGDAETGGGPVGWVNEIIWKQSPVGKKAGSKPKADAKK